ALPGGSSFLSGWGTMVDDDDAESDLVVDCGEESGDFDNRFAHLADSIEVRKVRGGHSGAGIDVSELGPASVLLDTMQRLAVKSGAFFGGRGLDCGFAEMCYLGAARSVPPLMFLHLVMLLAVGEESWVLSVLRVIMGAQLRTGCRRF
ncbi:hypothetical protein Dimus_036330, partial [Dionaea muscipula]